MADVDASPPPPSDDGNDVTDESKQVGEDGTVDETGDGEGEGGVEGEGEGAAPAGEPAVHVPAGPAPDEREIGGEAVWSLSTAKPGNGVEQLRDNNVDTYWQSDGGQHLINMQFHKKMCISQIDFYLDYKNDESYTPKKISIRTGTTFHDLREIHLLDLDEPDGWVSVRLTMPPRACDGLGAAAVRPDEGCLRSHFIQVCVCSMHQNGRDTHVRQVKIFGPRRLGALHRQDLALLPRFTTVAFQQFECLR